MRLKNLNWLSLSVLVIIVDQATKLIVKHHLQLGTSHFVNTIFNIVHARNYGAAFSFMDNPGGHQRWLFSLISLLVSVVLIVWLINLEHHRRWRAIALALIIGGALSNFWGRFTVGYVVDFLDFHIGAYHWPAFNIADSTVCVGAIILIINLGFNKR